MMESKNRIGDEWMIPDGRKMVVKNPSNLDEEVGVIHLSHDYHVMEAEKAARNALGEWASKTPGERGEVLYHMAQALQNQLEDLATLASSEMGKPITEMKGEVKRGIHLLKYYAAEGMRSDGSVIPASSTGVLQYTKRVPLGVVGIITPWNFPVAIPIWKLAPALICGNTVIWKPSENASLTATRLMEIFAATDLPPGVLNLLIGKGREIGPPLLEQMDLDGVSFTGSSETGTKVAMICAKRNIKYQTEMGGKNAAVVLRDADIHQTVPLVLSGAFRSAGQKCTATSRIIVEKGIFSAFTEVLKKEMAKIKMANALDPTATLGPVASKEQYDKVSSYVDLARSSAEVLTEKTSSLSDPGYYIDPIVVTGVDVKHQLSQEEIFGPLAVILEASDFEEAVEWCNQTVYGLSASLFTRDLSKAHLFLDKAEAGMVRVNQETAGVEYQAPFGGMKGSSSHTREQGQAALDFYSQVKTCAIQYR
ncbi:aldehyde dehydrogenase (NAD+) [Desmospora profundinema]|uniref:Aldehyde dehydrogenase (NAD+) n=2 Tax=Desmospora profundinema TaxID=1571184 RepID=A0ABU1IK45_9BACL|nr:aldehyde dehydrogenase (NAD+) [Desmospora profundinema]